MRAMQFVSPVDLPKEQKVNEFERLFDHPIVCVDIATGKDSGIGLESAWERGRKRVQEQTPAPPPPKPPKRQPVVNKRAYGDWDPAEVLKAWEDSGHNKAKAARLMRVHETTFRWWLKQVLPEVFGGKR